MADEIEDQIENSENEGAQDSEQPKSKKLVLIITVVLLSLATAAALVVFVVYPKYQEWAIEEANKPEENVKKEEVKNEIGQIYTISDLTVNPKDSGGRRYAVFEIAMEVPDQSAVDKLKQFQPIIIDRIISYFRARTMLELSDESKLPMLKEDIKKIVNDVVHQDIVRELYFTRFVLE